MRTHRFIQVVARNVIAVFLSVSIGCNKNDEPPKPLTKDFTPEEFKTVKKGMNESEVRDILGDPKESMQAMGLTRKFWQVGDKYYNISFKDGKVSTPFGPYTEAENDNVLGMMDAAQQWEQKKNAQK